MGMRADLKGVLVDCVATNFGVMEDVQYSFSPSSEVAGSGMGLCFALHRLLHRHAQVRRALGDRDAGSP
jgi:hypothetical protein